MKKLPVDAWHQKHGKMVEFAGWEMPLWYGGIREEHLAVRNSIGVFDVSHMGEIIVSGKDALSFLQWATTNDIKKPPPISGTYALVLNERGAIKDETLVYNMGDDTYMVVCDAVAVPKLVAHFTTLKNTIEQFSTVDLTITDKTERMCLFSVQGPKAQQLCISLFGVDIMEMWWFQAKKIKHNNVPIILSKSGYTGENGFELFFDVIKDKSDVATSLWEEILNKGAPYGIRPCGLGARDTLRIESGYTLYGHETQEKQVLSEEVDEVTPLEAGLDFAISFDKDFIGKQALLIQKERGVTHHIAHFTLLDKAIPREGDKIIKHGDVIGEITSGTKSPLTGSAIAIGRIKYGVTGMVSIEVRGTPRKARIVSPPFYDPKKYGAYREVEI